MNHTMTSNGGVNSGDFNPDLSQIEQQSQPQPLQASHQPGIFRTLLAGAASIAGNMFAPGLGSAIGSLIGGGLGRGASAAGAFASNAANLAQANQLLAVARQANQDEEMVELASNLQKSKHETFMAVIQNIGS
jgi:hypothetical protein